MLDTQIFVIIMSSSWIDPLIIMWCPSISLLIFFIWSLFCLIWGFLLKLSFASHLHGIYFSILSLSVYNCVQLWNTFLVDNIHICLVFVSIQPACVFWLKHLICLHLKQLLIYIFILPYFKFFGVDFVDRFLLLYSLTR